jgi:hypothetical protein
MTISSIRPEVVEFSAEKVGETQRRLNVTRID